MKSAHQMDAEFNYSITRIIAFSTSTNAFNTNLIIFVSPLYLWLITQGENGCPHFHLTLPLYTSRFL